MATPNSIYTSGKVMRWAVTLALASSLLVVLLLGLLLFTRLGSVFGLGPETMDGMSVVTQIKKLDQLVTVKYSVQRIVGIKEERQPLGEEAILLMVEGQVLAGVDLSSLAASDVKIAGERHVSIVVPQAKLLHVFLDERKVKVWDRRITWWTPWVAPDPELEHRARLAALDEVKAAALEMGILADAQRNAQATIQAFLQSLKLDATVTAR